LGVRARRDPGGDCGAAVAARGKTGEAELTGGATASAARGDASDAQARAGCRWRVGPAGRAGDARVALRGASAGGALAGGAMAELGRSAARDGPGWSGAKRACEAGPKEREGPGPWGGVCWAGFEGLGFPFYFSYFSKSNSNKV
jgi:hypothetical protein